MFFQIIKSLFWKQRVKYFSFLSALYIFSKDISIKDKMNNQTGIIYLDSGDYIELKDNKIKISKDNENPTE